MKTFKKILKSYYKPEEEERVKALERELKSLDNKYYEEHGEEFTSFIYAFFEEGVEVPKKSWKDKYLQERAKLIEEDNKIYDTVFNRYKEEKQPEGILEDIRQIADSYEKEEFLHYIKRLKELLKSEDIRNFQNNEEEGLKDRSYYTYIQKHSEENYYNCFAWLYGHNPEIEKLLSGDKLSEAIEIIKARIDSFGYERPEEGVLSYRDHRENSDFPELPTYKAIFPSDYQQNLTKASTTLFDSKNSIEALKQGSIDVSPNKSKGLITYFVNIDLAAPELKGTENITEFDKSVHNMAVSIARSNKHGFFTAKQVATALFYGDNPNNSNPSKQQIGAVTKSIEKLSLIRLGINWTMHIQLNEGKYPEKPDNYQVEDYMLPVRKHIAMINGQKVEGYEFLDKKYFTPLNRYALSVGQIAQHPLKMLNVPINLDQQKLTIRDFLLEEKSHIQNNPKSWNHTISVDKILKVAGEDPQTITRKKKSSLLQAVEKILMHWKEEGYIKDYRITKAKTAGNPLQSFTIEV